eukprot:gene6726-4850_t
MFSTDTLHDIAIRIVEVFTTPISAFGYGVVVEVVNKRNWVHIVRFVVTDIATLKIFLYKEAHFRSHRRENFELQESLMTSERPKRKGSSSKLPAHTIRLYDETEWTASLAAWDRNGAGTQLPTIHYPVDFRNSYAWGAKGL